jgi:hypothetical protein
MNLICKNLGGEFTIQVTEHTEAEVKHVIGAQFQVHPRRVTLFPWEDIDYGVFIQPPGWKLLEWIPLERLSWQYLSANPRAISLLEQHPQNIHWDMLSINPEGIPMLREHRDKIVWQQLAANPSPDAIPLLEEYLENGGGEQGNIKDSTTHYLFWSRLSGNPHAVPLLEKYIQHVKWYEAIRSNTSPDLIPFLKKHMNEHEIVPYLSHNPHAMELIEKHIEQINWSYLSQNTKAIHLLEDNLERIDWLSLSKNPNAIPILQMHQNKIVWYYLCENENAMSLIRQNMDKIRWSFLCNNRNPAAMTLIEQNIHQLDNDINIECSYDGLSLSKNPSALPLLSRHPHFINWNTLSSLPEIFEWVE